jgi:hypothetical protein
MMLVRNAPFAIDLAQAHGKPEQETVLVGRVTRTYLKIA